MVVSPQDPVQVELGQLTCWSHSQGVTLPSSPFLITTNLIIYMQT